MLFLFTKLQADKEVSKKLFSECMSTPMCLNKLSAQKRLDESMDRYFSLVEKMKTISLSPGIQKELTKRLDAEMDNALRVRDECAEYTEKAKTMLNNNSSVYDVHMYQTRQDSIIAASCILQANSFDRASDIIIEMTGITNSGTKILDCR
jgi:hypothetical protein